MGAPLEPAPLPRPRARPPRGAREFPPVPGRPAARASAPAAPFCAHSPASRGSPVLRPGPALPSPGARRLPLPAFATPVARVQGARGHPTQTWALPGRPSRARTIGTTLGALAAPPGGCGRVQTRQEADKASVIAEKGDGSPLRPPARAQTSAVGCERRGEAPSGGPALPSQVPLSPGFHPPTFPCLALFWGSRMWFTCAGREASAQSTP